MVESMSTTSKETHKRSNARWKAMMETQQEKLKLEREMVEATKLEALATMLKSVNRLAMLHWLK
jgi:adenine-specific DNA methylase